jgi:ankyrin repeat protein
VEEIMKKRIFLVLILFALVFIEQGIADIKDELYEAIGAGDVEKVKALMKEGANVSYRGTFGFTPVVAAVDACQLEVLRVLIEAGADPNIPARADIMDVSPLIMAIVKYEGREELEQVVKLLIGGGADVNWQDERSGITALMFCANLGSADLEKVTRLLIQAGLDPDVQNHVGETALHKIVEVGNLGVAKLLIEAGADVNLIDNTGRTVCFYAAQSGLAELIDLLLADFDIDVNAKDELGCTALMLASEERHADVVKLLLDAGADAKVVDKMGRSALAMAKKRPRNDDVIQLLIDAGAEE